MNNIISYIIEKLPEISVALSGVFAFIKLFATIRNNSAATNKHLKELVVNQVKVVADNEDLRKQNAELKAQLEDINENLKSVANLKEQVAALTDGVNANCKAVRQSVNAAIDKERATIDQLQKDKRRLGG